MPMPLVVMPSPYISFRGFLFHMLLFLIPNKRFKGQMQRNATQTNIRHVYFRAI